MVGDQAVGVALVDPTYRMLTIYPSRSAYKAQVEPRGTLFSQLGEVIGAEVVPFSSARAAMLVGLRTLGIGREDEVLVPPFLSHCVLSAVIRSGFPAKRLSSRTRGILVYHQFGFPQALDEISAAAKEHGLVIINDCANSLFSRFKQRYVTDWGDVTALSFSKFYACELGGGMIAHHPRTRQWVMQTHETLAMQHAQKSGEAFEILRHARQDLANFDNKCALDGVYGQLPEIIAFPDAALPLLPGSVEELEADRRRRTELWDLVKARFPHLVPRTQDCDVVPFAIPLSIGRFEDAQKLVRAAASRFGVELPILHFDFNCNMLDPDYRKALVLGCHSDWTTDLITQICDLVEAE